MTQLLDQIERIARFEGRPGDMEACERVGTTMKIGSLCAHGQLGFNPISSALTHFREEFETHITERRDPTGRTSTRFYSPKTTRPYSEDFSEASAAQGEHLDAIGAVPGHHFRHGPSYTVDTTRSCRMADDITITIDGKEVTAKPGTNVLQAAMDAGFYVPYLCYYPGMKSFGACRMCVVEIDGPARDGDPRIMHRAGRAGHGRAHEDRTP